MGVIVAVRDLRKRYGAVEALRGVSFEVAQGSIFGLLGPNGAGKTTTVECLLGLRQPDSGEIEVCGLDAQRNPRDVKARIGAALQTTALQDRLTPREALQLFGTFYPNPDSPGNLLERFALNEKADAPFESLSGGQRQRLALALAFLNRPEVVFLDEPTTGLDPESRRDLHEEILRLKQGGHTVLLTTHQLDEAERLCDEVAIVHRGKILASGSPRNLAAGFSGRHRVEATALHAPAPDLVAGFGGADGATVIENRIQFLTDRPEEEVARLLRRLAESGNRLVRLQVDQGSLEEVFLQVVRPSQEGERDRP